MPTLFPSRAFRRTRERASGLLFALGVDDLSPALATGQTLNLNRTTGRTVYDSTGRVVTLARGQLPWTSVYNAAAATWEPLLGSDRAATNLCLRSENFGATWTAVGTPTRTGAAATCGQLELDLIGDDAGGALEGYSQSIAFTGNGLKAISLFVKKGTATSSAIRLQDGTVVANRLLAAITWSGTVPVVAMTTGTFLGAVRCADDVYRLQFQTTSVTAANTNSLSIFPATTAALATGNTGTLYVGGVQAQNWPWPQAYIKTTTATATTAADLLTADFLAEPQDMTVYVRFPAPTFLAGLSGTGAAICSLGNIAGGASFYLFLLASGITATVTDGTTAQQVTGALTAGQFYDVAVQFNNVRSAARVRIDTGAGFGAYSTATGPITSWPSTSFKIGHLEDGGGPGYQLDGGIRRLIIAPGARTLAEMQGLAV